MDDILDLLVRIYTKTNSYIDGAGHHCHRIPTTFTDPERQRLIDAGLQPNAFIAIEHDDAVARLRANAAGVDLRRAADAFVASMTSADLGWHTVLPAVALGLAMPAHRGAPMGRS